VIVGPLTHPPTTTTTQHYFRYNVTDSLQSFKDFLYLSQATQVAQNHAHGLVKWWWS
jgi:hypothetical protein